jgi:predicted esterase
MSTLPVELSYYEYPIGHESSQESLANMTAWLSAQLDKVQLKKDG